MDVAKSLADLLPTRDYLVLSGDPGSGKTEWLKGQAVQWAQRSRSQIESGEVAIEVAPFPV